MLSVLGGLYGVTALAIPKPWRSSALPIMPLGFCLGLVGEMLIRLQLISLVKISQKAK